MMDQAQKAVVVQLFTQDAEQDLMVNGVEIGGQIALDEPARPLPRRLDGLERSTASAVGTETVRQWAELRFVIGFEDGANDFLEEFVLPGGDAEWA